MSSISTSKQTGARTIQFSLDGRRRRSLRLGTVTMRQARQIQVFVDDLVHSVKTGTRPTGKTQAWIAEVSEDIYGRLVGVGLCESKEAQVIATLEGLCERFIAGKRGSVKPATLPTYRRAVNHLYAYFKRSKPTNEITPADALDFQSDLRSKKAVGRDECLSDATCRKCCGLARQIFAYGEAAGWVERNPFAHKGIKVAVYGNEEKRRYIEHGIMIQLLQHAPSQEWRLLLVLGRYGGLRIPSEIKGMTWDHVNWGDGKLTVLSPKTEGSGRGRRVIPLFPEIRTELEILYEQAAEGDVYIFDKTIRGHTNLSVPLRRLGEKASVAVVKGLTWKNMRASAATDVLREYGPTLESAWIGHGQAIAIEHYGIVRDSDFVEAVGRVSNLADTEAVHNPVQSLPLLGRFRGNQEEVEENEFPSIPLESQKDNPLLSQGVTLDGRSWIRTNVG
ncbi:tyrosine-type recombinase/integrase [Poriferisphaera sp. WC338]|uniref:tyrosine-type recombinase/integrase n=1 Tax=Poriferisphaera sp. WC338 TaxID=3425129 RepID=UPI003D814C66